MARFINIRELKKRKFLKSLKSSYQEYKKKGGVSLDTLLDETEREIERLQR